MGRGIQENTSVIERQIIMYIVNKDRNMVVNIKQSASIDLRSNEIKAYINTEHHNILGEYRAKDRAKEVFTELLRSHFPAQFNMYDGVTNREVYYMPEE